MDRPSILIIGSSPQTGLLLKEALPGYSLKTVPTGREGLEAIDRNRPDLVILDPDLEDLDGYRLCWEIKESFPSMDLPVVFLSSEAGPEERIQGLECGAADFLTQPLLAGEIKARVRAQLEVHRLQQRLNRRLAKTNEELSSALEEIRKQNRRLKKELEAAAAVQRALLPGPAREIPNLALNYRFRPSASVAGDLLDWYVLDESRIGFYLADVSGHGAASGLLAASIHQALTPRAHRTSLVRTFVPGDGVWRPTPPEEIGQELERAFPYDRFDKYFTLFYGILNHRTGLLSYLTAGHPRPVLLREGDGPRELATTGPPIGLAAGGYGPAQEVLEPGDRLYVYSDGITEAEGPDGVFGRERLLESLLSGQTLALGPSLDRVLEDLKVFLGLAEPLDDVACLGLEMGKEQLRLF